MTPHLDTIPVELVGRPKERVTFDIANSSAEACWTWVARVLNSFSEKDAAYAGLPPEIARMPLFDLYRIRNSQFMLGVEKARLVETDEWVILTKMKLPTGADVECFLRAQSIGADRRLILNILVPPAEGEHTKRWERP